MPPIQVLKRALVIRVCTRKIVSCEFDVAGYLPGGGNVVVVLVVGVGVVVVGVVISVVVVLVATEVAAFDVMLYPSHAMPFGHCAHASPPGVAGKYHLLPVYSSPFSSATG